MWYQPVTNTVRVWEFSSRKRWDLSLALQQSWEKGHSGKCPRIKGSFRAGKRQEACRMGLDTVKQSMAAWKELYWMNAEVGRRVQCLPLTWTSLWNPYILGYLGKGKGIILLDVEQPAGGVNGTLSFPRSMKIGPDSIMFPGKLLQTFVPKKLHSPG